MIIITKNKNEAKKENYKSAEIPNFKTGRDRQRYLKIQKMIEILSDIESVSIQIKDIKYMAHSKVPQLVYLNTKFSITKNSYNNDDYITIENSKEFNSLIFAIVNAKWLLNLETLENKNIDEINQECIELQNQILYLNKLKERRPNDLDIEHSIKLFEYKLSCLLEYIKNPKQELKQNKVKNIFLKKNYK